MQNIFVSGNYKGKRRKGRRGIKKEKKIGIEQKRAKNVLRSHTFLIYEVKNEDDRELEGDESINKKYVINHWKKAK